MYQQISAPVFPMVDDAAVSLTNTTTKTMFQPGGAANPGYILPFMLKAGSIIEVNGWGTISTSGTTPNFTWSLELGQATPAATGTNVALAATSAFTLTNQANVAWPWRLKYFGRVTQAGTAASINGYGSIDISTSLTAFTPRNIPETTAAGIVTFNSSIPMAAVLAGTWSAAATSNIAFCHGLLCVVHG